jgi:hypothetical protein
MKMVTKSCKMAILVLLSVVWVVGAQSATVPVVLNEIMAANSKTLADPQGQYDDWVELCNLSPAGVNLAGMYLTDDPANPTQWQFPTNSPQTTTISASGYLVVWLDGDTTSPGLHASFKLSTNADQVYLYGADGTTLIDGVTFTDQRCDISYGRFPSGTGDWHIMSTATGGTVNNRAAYEGVVVAPAFSSARGFYDAPFDVTLTCATPGATIYYTTDGRDPYNWTTRTGAGAVYTGPIHISKTTCLRACAALSNWLASETGTQTYLFVQDVIHQSQQNALGAGYPSSWSGYGADYEMDPEIVDSAAYKDQMAEALLSLPVLSLVTDRENIFGTSGIYTNPKSEGDTWEKPVSAEFFTRDDSKEFQINCGIRVQGGASREAQKCPKHSFSLRFGSEYGPSKLEYDLFDGCPLKSFDTLQLRGGFNNSWTHWDVGQRERAQYMRDQWARDSLMEMGQADAGYGLHAHLYINGMYWGVYNIHERVDASHYADYNGGDADRIDATNGDPTYTGGEPGQVTDGTIDAWLELQTAVKSRDWAGICKVLDVNNFIDWAIFNNYAGATDIKRGNNWRAAGGGPDRRPWRIYSWDAEKIIESLQATGIGSSSDPTGFFTYLNAIQEYRVLFGDRVQKHMFNGGALAAERNITRWTHLSDSLENAIIAESARWGDYRRDVHQYSSGPYNLYTKNEYWTPQKNWILGTFFPGRASIILNYFKSQGLYPSVDAPVFNIGGTYQHGGHTPADASLSMTATAGTIWYTLDGTDPRVPAVSSSPGQLTLVAENAAKKVLVPTAAISEAWRGGAAFDDSGWTSGAGGVGYERSTGYESFFSINVQSQMYGKNGSCYIRIPFTVAAENVGKLSTLTLSVRCDDGFVAYLNGVEAGRKNFTGTPLWNSRASAATSDLDAVELQEFDLSAAAGAIVAGQNILAIQALNDTLTSSDFLMSAMLTAAQGSGAGTPSGVSPAAVRYSVPVTLSASTIVKARVLSGTTWSALNEAVYAVGPVAQNLRISEIMYHPIDSGHPDDPNTEFLELTNIGSTKINLNRVQFTKGITFTFGTVELAPQACTLVVRDLAAFQARYGNTLPIAGEYTGNLSNGGERLRLEDAAGSAVEDFSYSDHWYELTDGKGYSLTIVDPGNPSDANAWRPSTQAGGSPGYDDVSM